MEDNSCSNQVRSIDQKRICACTTVIRTRAKSTLQKVQNSKTWLRTLLNNATNTIIMEILCKSFPWSAIVYVSVVVGTHNPEIPKAFHRVVKLRDGGDSESQVA